MEEKTAPRNRDEQEIAGYRDVLNIIHESFDAIPITQNYILQLHKILYSHMNNPVAGRTKSVQNYISATYPDGHTETLFTPMAPYETPEALDRICEEYNRVIGNMEVNIDYPEYYDIEVETNETILPKVDKLLLDIDAFYEGDPASNSKDEIIIAYPGFYAIMMYRLAHELYLHDVPLLPRIITEIAHAKTGIDIHPGANIGHHFFIDHGNGVIIGETAIVGNNVTLYQGVTLGARSFPTDENDNLIKGIPRHPIIGDNVVIYSNATILGRVTIGSGAVVGGNIWVTTDVAPGEKLVQAKSKQHTKIDKDE